MLVGVTRDAAGPYARSSMVTVLKKKRNLKDEPKGKQENAKDAP
jgi:hypothetical protein